MIKKLLRMKTMLRMMVAVFGFLFFLQKEGRAQTYCIPQYSSGCSSGDDIDDVTLVGATQSINNLNTPCATGGYSDYTGTDTADMIIGLSYSGTVTTNYSCCEYVTIWIDYNNNGTFETSEQVAISTVEVSSSAPFNFTVTPPVTAAPGFKRMRVRLMYGSATTDPCVLQSSWGEAHDYTVNIVAPIACDDPAYTMIATTAATASRDTICSSADIVELNISTMPGPASGLTYQWQTAPSANGPWANVGTAGLAPSYTVTGIGSTTYYRCQIYCLTNVVVTSAPVEIASVAPVAPMATNGGRCGPGTVDLSAGGVGPGMTIGWYADPTGGTPLDTGINFTTPYLSASDTFWVSTTVGGGGSMQEWIGTGTTSISGFPSPYHTGWWGNKSQYLITPAEMLAAGYSAGIILGLGFDVLAASGIPLTDFTISLGHTTQATLTTTFITGLTQVFSTPVYTVTANSVNMHNFTTPFVWDGVSNIVVETCFNNSSYSGSVTVRGTSNITSTTRYADAAGTCAQTTASTTYSTRPNILLDMIVGCESARVPVEAVISTPPLLTVNYHEVVCNDDVVLVNISSPTVNFNSNEWYTGLDANGDYTYDNLFADAATTIPYLGGNAFAVYFRSDVAGAHQVYLYSGQTTGAMCTNADTANIWVQPGNIVINSQPDTICVSGSTDLTLSPGTDYAPGSIQWQSSTNGTSYANVAGANSASWTTPVLTSSLYYRVNVGSDTGICETSVKHTIVVDPQLTGTTPGTRCGPGTVDLAATASTGAGISWYDSPTGGSALGTGTTFTTPYITSTTTFYAAPGSGGGSTVATFLEASNTGGNSCSGGSMFNMTPNSDLYVDSIKARAAAAGTNVVVNVYIKAGTYVGSEQTPTAWTLHESVTIPTMTANSNFNIPLSTPINLISGVMTGVYLEYNASYTTQTAQITHSNGDLTIVSGAGLCSSFGGVNPNRSFNGIVHYRAAGCEGPRVPVTATVTPGPAFSISHPDVVCNDAVATISITSPAANYPNQEWYTGVTVTNNTYDELYINAGGTTPYNGTNVAPIYFRSDIPGEHVVYVYAQQTTGQMCAAADTALIWVQPGGIVINGLPDTICVEGDTRLTLDPDANYAEGSIQWFESTNGTNYTLIVGEDSVQYITDTITNNRYYRAVISADAGVCETVNKYVVVADPTLLSWSDSFNCGPGSVTLQATVGGNGIAKWYDTEIGGMALGQGNTFVTPFLNETDTFYVASGTGGGASKADWVGTGTAVLSGNPNPYYTLYYGHKNQYLIPASELQALGFSAGLIQSIAFDVVAASGMAMTNFSISMGNTSLSTLTTTFVTGLTQVYTTPAYVPVANSVNVHTLTTPFVWDGASNLVIETCFNNTSYSSGHSVRYNSASLGYTAAISYYADNATVCPTATASVTYQYRPNIQLDIISGCETDREMVIATIYDVPEVNLGPDIAQCAGISPNNYVHVDAGNPGYTYQWNTGFNQRIIPIGQTGVYSVIVTHPDGCKGYDTINVTLHPNPTVDLGANIFTCVGDNITLDGGAGAASYSWSTGATSQTINATTSGTYHVTAISSEGCESSDTVNVSMNGGFPTISGIDSDPTGLTTFEFKALNPVNVMSYQWDFGDGSSPPFNLSSNPTHTYPCQDGTYKVTLTTGSNCGFRTDTFTVVITGVEEDCKNSVRDLDESLSSTLKVYPNPTSEKVVVESAGDARMESIRVLNLLGQIILEVRASHPLKQELNLQGVSSGMYQLQITTDKGVTTRKLELIR